MLVKKVQDNTVQECCRRIRPEVVAAFLIAVRAHHDTHDGLHVRKFLAHAVTDFSKRVPSGRAPIRAERLELQHALTEHILAEA